MTITLSYSRKIRSVGLTTAALLLSACSILPQSETLTVYQLPAAKLTQQPPAKQGNGQPLALRVATPYSSQIIDSVRILVVPQASQISAYSGVRWSDPAPVLVRNRLASAFRASGLFASVSVDNGSTPDADFELAGDLAAFQAVYENEAPVVHIHYDASLVQSATNRSIATRSFDITEPVQGKDAPEVVKAFGRAADRLATEMLEWTVPYTKAARVSQ